MKLKESVMILLVCVSIVLALEILTPINLVSVVMGGNTAANNPGHDVGQIYVNTDLDMNTKNIANVNQVTASGNVNSLGMNVGASGINVAGSVVINGNLYAKGADLLLGVNQWRALVFEPSTNKLVINYNGDFSGGVRVGTSMDVTGTVKANTFFGDLEGSPMIGPIGSHCGWAKSGSSINVNCLGANPLTSCPGATVNGKQVTYQQRNIYDVYFCVRTA